VTPQANTGAAFPKVQTSSTVLKGKTESVEGLDTSHGMFTTGRHRLRVV
jgi:hypothetical protein